MEQKIILLIFTFVASGYCSQNDNPTSCTITYLGNDGTGNLDWNNFVITVNDIKDTDSLHLNYTFTGDLQVDTPYDADSGAKYVEASTAGRTLTIETTDYFRNNFDEDLRFITPIDAVNIARSIKLTCAGQSYIFNLGFYVYDTNNHAPKFSAAAYTYKMPMPLVPKIDLTGFDTDLQIVVEDIDFSNSDITFSVDSPDFALKTVNIGSRRYRAILTVPTFITFDKDLTLNIIATDNVYPYNSAQATIIIQKDETVSLPEPITFSQSVYKFTYSENNGNPVLTTDDKMVIISDDPDQVTITLDSENFAVVYDPTSQTVVLAVISAIKQTSEPVITLTLTATTIGQRVQVAILVYLSTHQAIAPPGFSFVYYKATYLVKSGQDVVELDAGQRILVTENADVTLIGDSRFGISHVGDDWQISVLHDLSQYELGKLSDIELILQASVTEGEVQQNYGYATLVVKLPGPVC